MMTLYDFVMESILDDEDDLMNQSHNIISKSWFDEYAKGDFKVKISKKGVTKVTGNMIIKDFDGEMFPGLNIDEFNGSLTIEKCPNLVSMEGLFKPYFHKLIGDLTINNCPKLTKLSCPFSIEGNFYLTGNSSLKSLEGAPTMVNGEVYIMKNGKKFKEEQIKQHIEYIGDFICCSGDEFEADVNESEELNEALNNPYLLLLAKQLKETNGLSFKNIFGGYSIAWDQIDSTNIKNYNWRYKTPSDKDLKAARLIISGKVSGFIITYYYGEDGKIVFDKLINYNKIVRNLHGSIRGVATKSTEIIDMIVGSVGSYYNRTDGMLIITGDFGYSSELATYNKEYERRKSREGMVENTPEYYRKVAQANMERYKKIIEANKANRNSGAVEKVQKMVDSFLKDIMKASQNVLKNPTKYANKLLWLDSLNECAYSKVSYGRGGKYGTDGVLVLFNRYMELWSRAATGNKNYTYGATVDDSLKNIQARIEERISDAQHYLNKFDV